VHDDDEKNIARAKNQSPVILYNVSLLTLCILPRQWTVWKEHFPVMILEHCHTPLELLKVESSARAFMNTVMNIRAISWLAH
jgi:hypothetical protein